MRTRLRLFLEWGITFGEPYAIPEKAARPVAYANKQELELEILSRHHTQRIVGSAPSPASDKGVAGKGKQDTRPDNHSDQEPPDGQSSLRP